MKKIWILAIAIMFTTAAWAQNDVDAFRFSQTNWSGTARFMGAGGAFGAIGGDFSALSTNPGAIGLFKKDEITLTPLVINAINTNSVYRDESVDANRIRYSLTNFGAVFSWHTASNADNQGKSWKMMQFAFGYNRIQDFNNTVYATGMNGGNSMATVFASCANGTNYNSLSHDAALAWNAWLIDTVPGTVDQYRDFLSGNNLRQNYYAVTTGGIDEMTFSWGGNYNDQLYLGITMGVPFLDYNCETEYEEVDENDEVSGFQSFKTIENLKTSGVGINAKLGLIYQPVDFFRFGVSIHTPTYYGNLKEKYTRELTPTYDDAQYNQTVDYENISKYKLTTPFRVSGSLGFIIAKRAFLSAEYEFADYAMAKLSSSDNALYRYSFKDENKTIANKYGACHTVRLGGELTVTEHFLVRAGYSFSSSPYKNSINTGMTHNICAGIGFRTNVFFWDFAYVCRLAGENNWFYSDELLEPVTISNVNHKFAATFGVKF